VQQTSEKVTQKQLFLKKIQKEKSRENTASKFVLKTDFFGFV